MPALAEEQLALLMQLTILLMQAMFQMKVK
jgi:hypothetical protein